MVEVIYNGHLCKILKIWDGDYYDLETIEETEKLIIEKYLSIHKSELQINKIMETEKIKVRIRRCLNRSGSKPYYLTGNSDRIIREYDTFSTLKDLKEYYEIDKITENGTGWALRPNGKKIEWKEYDAEISSKFIKL